MTKRIVGAALLGLLVSITAAAASCSFPTYNITVTSGTGGGGGATATASTSGDGTGGASDASTTTSATTSSGTGGAGTSTSTASSSATSTGTGTTCVGADVDCDCDDDKVKATTCGGADCNDHDPLVHTGQKMFFKDPIAGSNKDYDYDCSGKEDYETTITINCAVLVALCPTSTVGWLGPVPDCGVTAQFGTCKISGGACVNSVTGTQPQRCR